MGGNVNLALGTLFLFLAGACFYVASHGVDAVTPFGVYRSVLDKMAGGEHAAA